MSEVPPNDFTRQIQDARDQLHALVAGMRGEGGRLLADILNRNPHMVAAMVINHLENLVDNEDDDTVVIH